MTIRGRRPKCADKKEFSQRHSCRRKAYTDRSMESKPLKHANLCMGWGGKLSIWAGSLILVIWPLRLVPPTCTFHGHRLTGSIKTEWRCSIIRSKQAFTCPSHGVTQAYLLSYLSSHYRQIWSLVINGVTMRTVCSVCVCVCVMMCVVRSIW